MARNSNRNSNKNKVKNTVKNDVVTVTDEVKVTSAGENVETEVEDIVSPKQSEVEDAVPSEQPEEKKEDIKKTISKKIDARALSSLLKGKKFKEAIEIGRNVKEVKDIADVVKRYAGHINSRLSPEEYVRYNYSIYNTIKNIINEKDINKFRVRFRYLVSLICLANKEKIVNEITLLKYDYKWQWGGAEYDRFAKLVTVIFTACERGIRNVKKVVDFDRLGIILSPEANRNLKEFF